MDIRVGVHYIEDQIVVRVQRTTDDLFTRVEFVISS